MSPSLHPNNITLEDFQNTLKRYGSHVPAKLKELDNTRLEILPKALQNRATAAGTYLEQEDLEELVQWKLGHGTFRPNLLKLCQLNDKDTVKRTSAKAFAKLEKPPYSDEALKSCLQELTSIKGVGPATAALLLSTLDPRNIPFFGDELFRYLHWDVAPRKAGDGRGWKRKINYTVLEWLSLVEQMRKFRERFEGEDGVSAIDVEKVAYVLGKEDVDLDQHGRDDAVASTEVVPTVKQSKGVNGHVRLATSTNGQKRKAPPTSSIADDGPANMRKSSRKSYSSVSPD